MRSKRGFITTLATLVSVLLLALAVSPLTSFGADHLDAPDLTPPSGRADADINDVYVFAGSEDVKAAAYSGSRSKFSSTSSLPERSARFRTSHVFPTWRAPR